MSKRSEKYGNIAGFCKYFYLVLFSIPGFSKIQAVEPELFRAADSLRSIGEYQFAAIEYERAYFISEDAQSQTSALIMKAECLKAIESFDLAEKCLMRINYFGISDSLIFRARYQTALCSYLAGHFTNAESQLLQMSPSGGIKDSQLIIQSMPLFILVLNEQNKWDNAKQKFIDWIKFSSFQENMKDSLNNLIETLYSKKNLPKLKKQGTAKVLSSILPGTGQLYAGYFFEGIANASLQGASLLLAAYGIYSGFYISSVVVWFGLFQKFYSGAIMRTEFLVEKRNFELSRNFNNTIKKEITAIQK